MAFRGVVTMGAAGHFLFMQILLWNVSELCWKAPRSCDCQLPMTGCTNLALAGRNLHCVTPAMTIPWFLWSHLKNCIQSPLTSEGYLGHLLKVKSQNSPQTHTLYIHLKPELLQSKTLEFIYGIKYLSEKPINHLGFCIKLTYFKYNELVQE